MMELEKCRMEMQGIEPRASRTLSRHCTNWVASPIGVCSYDIVSYCIGSAPLQLELGNMLGRGGFGFLSNLNELRIPRLKPNPFIKQDEKASPVPI